MAHIAFLGTGLLGSGFVEAFLARGHSVAVWNRTAEKAAPLVALGARAATNPSDAVRGAARVHICLSSDDAVDSVLAAAGPLGEVPIVDHSTCSPMGVAARAQRLAAAGARFLSAPVFMSPANARDGKGLMVMSGDHTLFASLESELQAMTGTLIWLGEQVDRAAAVKLLGNAVGIGLVAVFADVLALSRDMNVPFEDLASLLDRFNPMNAARARLERMNGTGPLDASFTLDMARKDVGIMLGAAVAPDRLPVLAAVASTMDACVASGGGALDYAIIGRR